MPLYTYKARTQAGKAVSGQLTAENEDELAGKVFSNGHILTYAKTLTGGLKSATYLKVNRRELIAFTHCLIAMEASGIPITAGLRDLAAQTEHQGMRKVIEYMRSDIENGDCLSEAMEKYPGVFSAMYVSVVRAGEATGIMEDVLNRLASQMEWQEETTNSIKQVMIYPAVLLTAIAGLVILLLTWLLPRIMKVFLHAQVELPFFTRVLVKTGNFIKAKYLLLIIIVALLLTAYRIILRNGRCRLYIDMIKLKIPFFGGVIRSVEAAQFAHTFSILHRAGVGVVESLRVVEGVIGNELLARAVARARKKVADGESISESLKRSGQFQPLVIRMLAVGQETGKLDVALAKASQFYDREVPASIKRFFAFLEPALIVFSGLLVGFILLSTFLPMYQLMSLVRK
jgi:type IV pilus assembly protein PilC